MMTSAGVLPRCGGDVSCARYLTVRLSLAACPAFRAAHGIDGDFVHYLALAGDLDRVLRRTRRIDHDPWARLATLRERRQSRTAWSGRLAGLAARLLPSASRARYSEEFRAELAALVQAGAGRWQQLAFATGLLVAAPRLRVELTAARRRSASS
jgi:hypothetical protein